MKQLELSVEKRVGTGRQYVRKLRESGRVPAVVYGKSGTQSLSFDEKEFRLLLREKGQGASLVNIKIVGGGSVLSTIADMKRDPISDRFLHVDFHEVSRAEKMTTAVPVEFVGKSIGVKDFGGVLDIARHEVNVKCLPADLPSSVKVNISALKVGDIVHIKDLEKIKSVDFVDGDEVAVVSCKNVAEEKEEFAPEAESKVADASPSPEATAAAEAKKTEGKEAK
ncbi:MAG: 50S ribosomal protein L25 [Puniceicoccales bacterium]|jgi:large subunit ribosomal protein L25|nr:50S ribosomal protein L25 [Puniceicoccales bacterium]